MYHVRRTEDKTEYHGDIITTILNTASSRLRQNQQ